MGGICHKEIQYWISRQQLGQFALQPFEIFIATVDLPLKVWAFDNVGYVGGPKEALLLLFWKTVYSDADGLFLIVNSGVQIRYFLLLDKLMKDLVWWIEGMLDHLFTSNLFCVLLFCLLFFKTLALTLINFLRLYFFLLFGWGKIWRFSDYWIVPLLECCH